MSRPIFHLAFPVHDIEEARKFYIEGLGCVAGRRSAHSLILELHGHQIVAQKVESKPPVQNGIYPRHYGLIFTRKEDWAQMLERCRERGLRFYGEPRLRHPGTPTEHHTFFLMDPSNNLLEFKHYTRESAIFGDTECGQVGDHR